MSATNTLENGLLSLLFENTNYANVGDATGLRGSTTAGSYYISLHTGDPLDTGTQTTNETAYTNYVRVAVARDSANWTVTSGNCENDAAITYATCGASGQTLSHFGIGHSSTGTGTLHIKGQLTSLLAVSNGITPSFAAGALDISIE